MNKLLPNFKNTFLIVGFSYVLLAVGLFAKGLITSMAEFKVPEPVIHSPHYFDAMLWVYVHMIVIGILVIVIGASVTEFNKQKWISVLLFIITTIYTYMDFRTADWAMGNALYKGESSLAPAFIGVIVNLLFLQIAIRLFLKKAER